MSVESLSKRHVILLSGAPECNMEATRVSEWQQWLPNCRPAGSCRPLRLVPISIGWSLACISPWICSQSGDTTEISDITDLCVMWLDLGQTKHLNVLLFHNRIENGENPHYMWFSNRRIWTKCLTQLLRVVLCIREDWHEHQSSTFKKMPQYFAMRKHGRINSTRLNCTQLYINSFKQFRACKFGPVPWR